MKHIILIASINLLFLSFCFSAVGQGAYFAYQFTNATAVGATVDALGLNSSNTNEMGFEVHPYIILGDYFRFGGLISGSFFRVTGEPSPEALPYDDAGVGFGDARLGFLLECYDPCKKWDRAVGLGFGYGAIFTFIEDVNCNNDGEQCFYYFLRPQATLGYDLGAGMGIEIGAGYHLPIVSDENELWFVNTALDTVRNGFDASEMSGPFVKIGIVFGAFHSPDHWKYAPLPPRKHPMGYIGKQ